MRNIKIIQELHGLGITGYHEVSYNPSYEELYQAEMSNRRKGYEKGAVTESGAVAVKTGVFTGRSPKDRYIVKDDVTKDTIYWDDKVNFSTTPMTTTSGPKEFVLTFTNLPAFTPPPKVSKSPELKVIVSKLSTP